MSTLLLGTNAVRMDEPCIVLKEFNGPAPDSKSIRRWQMLQVIRDDQRVEFRRDLGPASLFTAEEVAIIGGVYDPELDKWFIEETVGRLVDAAEKLRAGQYNRPDPPQPSDLIGQYRDLPDKRRRWRKRASQFGPKARIQRG